MGDVLMCCISGSKGIGTMNSHDGPLNRTARSAALRRKADRLHSVRGMIDRYASLDAEARYALLSTEISALHEAARRLQA